jgi:alpha-ketoglutarate-dependent 2,4-dichlorophenoxyacetate dioxygenase
MSLPNVELLHPDFGARVTGIDLREPISADSVTDIQQAIDEYSFLYFPDQPLDDDLQLAFTRLLGEPEPNHVKLGQDGVVEHFGTIGNVQEDGSTLGNDHQKTRFQTGNNLWHSDSSFRDVPTFVSIMCAYEVPDEGGKTEFVSERASYERLPEDTKSTIDPLVAIHDYVFSRSKVGPDAVTPAHSASLPPVRQKLVRKNPGTGAKNFFAGSHAKEIEGWDFEKSRELLDDLVTRATAADHIYSHAWKSGDLVIWDNRCLLHRGSGYDADKYRRRMRQTRVKGLGPTIDEN